MWQVKLVGGYYDAGDNVKFGWPMSFSVTLLSWAAIEFHQPILTAKQMGHLREAIKWGSDFISAAHTSPTTLYTQVTHILFWSEIMLTHVHYTKAWAG